METDLLESLSRLFTSGSEVMRRLPRGLKNNLDEVEVVFMDTVNGRPKHRRGFTFIDIMEAIEERSKPIGLILINWNDVDEMQMKEFPNLTSIEQAILAAAFAESQDQQNEGLE